MRPALWVAQSPLSRSSLQYDACCRLLPSTLTEFQRDTAPCVFPIIGDQRSVPSVFDCNILLLARVSLTPPRLPCRVCQGFWFCALEA